MKKVLSILLLYVSVNAFAQEQKSKKQEQKSKKENILEELYNEFEQEQQREKKKKFLEYLRKQKSKKEKQKIKQEEIQTKKDPNIESGLSLRLGGGRGQMSVYGAGFEIYLPNFIGGINFIGGASIDAGTLYGIGTKKTVVNINFKVGLPVIKTLLQIFPWLYHSIGFSLLLFSEAKDTDGSIKTPGGISFGFNAGGFLKFGKIGLSAEAFGDIGEKRQLGVMVGITYLLWENGKKL